MKASVSNNNSKHLNQSKHDHESTDIQSPALAVSKLPGMSFSR